jgi:cytochrome P450
MPNRQTPGSAARSPSFRSRYDTLEVRRAELMARLAALGENAAAHPAHRRVRTLLNTTFRKSSLVQRAAILQAADWLITVLDRTITLI